MTPKEIHEDMVTTLGEVSPSYSTVKKSVANFKRDKESTKDDPRSGRPQSATTDNQVEAIHCMVINDRLVTIRHIRHQLWRSSKCFVEHLGDEQVVCKVGAPNVDSTSEVEQIGSFKDAFG
uniref:Uncharacterized protein LOC100378135 n=1 Tax=Saccoglossus kowalevskii TaxID=10224 RepID=A0ABM0MNY8_SACKO|nr:PREDICTED: uncharacterized protein LOC100378135 [Saccoglossus kowalevskii]